MRSLMNGFLSVSAFSVPIKVFSAIEDEKPRTHRYHKKCKTPLKFVSRCEKCDTLVPTDDIINVYQVPDSDEVVVLSPEEEKMLFVDGKKVTIKEFVPEKYLDSVRFTGNVYYLGVEPKQSDDGYLLIFKSMVMKKLMAIATWTYRQRERLVLIRASKRGVFVMQPIYYDSEIRSTAEIPRPVPTETPRNHLALCLELMGRMTSTSLDESLNKYKDQYNERLKKILENHEKGIPTGAPVVERPAPDIITALKKSLEEKAA